MTIKNTDLHSVSHQAVFETPTNITEEVYRAACRLFEELWDGSAIRLLGISTSRIKEEGCARQMNIFEGESMRNWSGWITRWMKSGQNLEAERDAGFFPGTAGGPYGWQGSPGGEEAGL